MYLFYDNEHSNFSAGFLIFFIFFSSPKFAHFFTPAEQRNSTNSTALIRNESGTQAKGRDISRVSRGFFENYMVCPHHHHHWSLRAGTRVCLRDGIEPWNSTLHLLSAENSTFSLFFSFFFASFEHHVCLGAIEWDCWSWWLNCDVSLETSKRERASIH